jgi:hypothetical protein
MKKYLVLSLLAVFASVIFSNCKKDAGTATVIVHLVDTPGTYDAVHVEVTGVDVHNNTNGWMDVPFTDTIYDLLQLQNNANAVLGTLVVPAGILSQVRLILGTQNTVTVSSVVHPLSLSSQDESGLKLDIHQALSANTTYTLVLDFNAAQSIIDNGNGTYKLKPVIKASFQ